MSTIQLRGSVKIDNTGRRLELPLIYIADAGILKSHAQYLAFYETRSHSWKTKSAQAVRLLLDYEAAHRGVFPNPQKLLESFASAIYAGTRDREGFDPSGLNWDSKKVHNGNVLIDHVTKYSEWLHYETDGKSALLNKIRQATPYEKIMLQAAYQHKYGRAFLKHTLTKDNREAATGSSRHISNRHDPLNVSVKAVKSFPETHIKDLLSEFTLKGSLPTDPIYKRFNLKNVLITIIMHYGSLRVSEPFHLYVHDIKKAANGVPIIDVYHPRLGLASDDSKTSREEYLRKNFQLNDRQSSTKPSYHAGWKNPTVDNTGAMRVYFFPSSMENVFYDLWELYVRYQRVSPTAENNHPFAFTNQDGDPASLPQFVKAHSSAVRKIGLTVAKNLGTSPHGHRHATGQRLSNAKVDPKVIQKIMHHRSLESQNVYTALNEEKIRCELEILDQEITCSVSELFG